MHVLFLRFTEIDKQVLLHRVFHPVLLVVPVQFFDFLPLVPVLVSFFQQRVCLCIDPFIIHRCPVIQRLDGRWQEPPVPSDVLQALPVVRAGNERRMPHVIVCLCVVRLPLGDALLCNGPFQPCYIPRFYPFKLLHTDDQVRAEQYLVVLVSRFHHSVAVILSPFRW